MTGRGAAYPILVHPSTLSFRLSASLAPLKWNAAATPRFHFLSERESEGESG